MIFLFQVSLNFARRSEVVGRQMIEPLVGDVRPVLASLSTASLPGIPT